MQHLLYRIQYFDDQAAFKEFYQQQVFRLFQFAYAFIKDNEVAEEIVNDVFLSLWQKRSKLDRITNINVYLYVAIKNTSLNYLRTVKGRRQVDLDSLEVHHFNLTPNPEYIFITREMQKMVEQAINNLPPRRKLVFKLIKEDGLSYKEVASILNISTKTVDMQLTIALKKLAIVIRPALTNSGVPVNNKS